MSPGPAGRLPAGREDRRPRSVLEEERDFFLRSLRDLDAEHEAGDIDDTDYAALREDYVARAAAVLRLLEDGPGPGGGSAGPAPTTGEPAGGHDGQAGPGLDSRAGRGTGGGAGAGGAAPGAGPGGPRRRLRGRRLLVTGVVGVLAAGAVAWALLAATGSRLPGQTVSGQALGAEAVAHLLEQADQAAAKGDAVTAVRDYQKVLDQQPNQPQALAGEGWLLAETQQPALLEQGLGLLRRAEQADPTYGPAHVYRGIALLSEGDDAGAVPELQYYLAHHPDPQLEAKVAQALRQAQADLAAQRAATAPGRAPATPPASPPTT